MRLKILGLVLLLSLSSCEKYLYPNRMFRIGPGYDYAEFDGIVEKEYRLAPDDILNIRLFTNEGSGMLNITTSGSASVGGNADLSIRIESDGFSKLPLFGRVYLEGLTIRQAEMLLEDRFAQFYNNPFVLLEVANKRVFIFAGDNTQVVKLQNDNTTLFEVLASVGGLPSTARSRNIKIIRGDLRAPNVYLVDLSTIEGMKNANLVMQGNDIIYVEVRNRYVSKTLAELTPYIAILSTVTTTIALFIRFRSYTN